jgi:hypothetical protein
LAAHNLLASIIYRVLPTVAERLDQSVVVVGGELGPDAQQRGQSRRLG